jgi:glycosyltransferase involved in cell wall biosynthesis
VEHSDAFGAGEGIDVGDAPFALMVGPNAAHKNIAPVALALADRGIHVVVVGGAGAQAVFRGEETGPAAVDETGPGEIQRVGRISDAKVAWLYRHAAVLVFPSLYEGFGLPVVEAQRLGCPVVASDRASVPEIAGESALLVDPTDPDLVAHRVAELLADPPRLAQLAAKGRANAARFRWDASASRLAETLTELLGAVPASGQP